MQDGFDEKAEDRFACVERVTAYREGMSTTFGEQLRAAREAKRLSKAELARQMGISGSAISQWEANDTKPEIGRFVKLVELLELDQSNPVFREYIEAGLVGAFTLSPFPAEVARGEYDKRHNLLSSPMQGPGTRKGIIREPSDVSYSSDLNRNVVIAQAKSYKPIEQLQGFARDVPVKGIAVAGEDGDFILNGEDVDWAIRPQGLSGLKDIFALYVINDSMYPAWKEGALFYVTPHRPPSPGDDVVIEVRPEVEGEAGAAFLKRYKGRSGNRIIVEQFNPPGELEFDVRLVKLYRVIPWEEALGLST